MTPALIEAASATTRPNPNPLMAASSHDPPIEINRLASDGLGREALDRKLARRRTILRAKCGGGCELGYGLGERRVIIVGDQDTGLAGPHDLAAAGHVG